MDKVILHSRQKKILSILNVKHGIVTGKEISAKIGVSERTIRSDISQINNILQSYGIQIQPIHGKGYTLSMKDRSVFLQLFSEKENFETKEDRLRALILRLLREDDWCDVGDLEDEMFVSHSTIEEDLKRLKHKISQQQPYLKVERKGNLIRLEDDEQKKRNLLTRFYVDNWDYDSKEGIVLGHEEIGNHVLSNIHQVLKRHVIDYKTYLDDYAFIYLTLAIYVSLFRIQTGHSVERKNDGSAVVDEVVRKVMDIVNESWKLEISEAEYAYISEIKEQLVFLSDRTYSKNYILSMTDTDCHHIVDDVLKELLEEYGLDFTTDDKLFVDLTRHVQAIKNGIVPTSVQNRVLGDELRRKHPFLGDIAHALKNKLSEKCDMDLGEEEADYLLPFIILAEETLYKKKRGKGIPTAVISHYNESMSLYLMDLLKRYYGDVLDLHGPYAIHAKEMIRPDETMLVLTTVQMPIFDDLFKIPVLMVSPLIETRDQKEINLYLYSIKSAYLYQSPELVMENYFLRSLCYFGHHKNNLLTVLDGIQQKVRKEICIENVPEMNLQKDYYCILDNGFFFYYQLSDQISQTVVSLVDLDKESSCKYARNIKMVMYMLMPPSKKATLGWFYYVAMGLSQHPEEVKKFLMGTSFEELKINIIKQ